MRRKSRYFKQFIALVSIFVALTIGYLLISVFAYQKLVNEGSVLADNQCLNVNPIIISRKNSYIKSLQAINDNDFEEYEKQTDNYFKFSKEYVAAQTKWLEDQNKFVNRWDFQHFNPSYIKNAANHQYYSRLADMESTKLLIDSYEVAQLNKSLSEELALKSMEKIKIRNDADKKYDEIWNNPGKLDWRTRFIKVPTSKCPDENFNIPDVDEFLNPESVPANLGQPIS